jgi:ABC-type lipoprotein release transport system permease subunit
MAATVVHRTREIGVRLALGARAGDVARWVLARGLRLAAAGAAVGLALSLAGTRLLRSQRFGVSPTDPLTLAATLGALLAVAAVACWLPARRAMRVSPTETLKA